jgi:hypothetical protein
MMLDSFVDEIVKLGGLRCLYKRADGMGGGSMNASAAVAPSGLIGSGEVPWEKQVHPDDATTRLEGTAHKPSAVASGHLGEITPARASIDRDKFNRRSL